MVHCNCCLPTTFAHCSGYIGLVLAIIGALLAVLSSRIINMGLSASLTITPGTLFYDEFIEPTPPIYLSVWIWDIQNPDDYTFEMGRGPLAKGEFTFPKPVVKQVGPFVYREKWLKDGVKYQDERGNEVFVDPEDEDSFDKSDLFTVQARQTYSYESVYDPSLPWTGLDPNAHKVNIASILSIGLPNIVDYILHEKNVDGPTARIVKNLINSLMDDAEALPIIKDITAQEALFNYEDPMLKIINELCQQNEICEGTPLANLPTEFGILVLKDTPLGWHFSETDTGVNDINEYGQVRRFKLDEGDEYEPKLSWWPEDSKCELLKGTDGSNVSPYLKKDESIWLFSADIFRSIYLNYTGLGESPTKGMTTHEYTADMFVFAAPYDNKDNECYCYGNYFWDEKDTGIDCFGISGGIVVDAPNFGIPLVISLPHFLGGEPFMNFIDERSEMNPSVEEFSTVLEFEPLTGSVMKSDKRIQQSLAVIQSDDYHILENIPTTSYQNMDAKMVVMPLVWVNESVVINEELEAEVYTDAVVGTTLLMVAWIVLLAVGIILMTFSWIIVKYRDASCKAFWCCENSVEGEKKGVDNGGHE